MTEPTTHNQPHAAMEQSVARLAESIDALLAQVAELRRQVADRDDLIAAYEGRLEAMTDLVPSVAETLSWMTKRRGK